MGMFTTRDPIGLRGGDNIFQYAPNPIGWVDPLGLRFTGYSLDNAVVSLRGDESIVPVYTTMTGHKMYSKHQIYDRWNKLEKAYLAKMISTRKMLNCPKSAPTACSTCKVGSSKWRVYGGDSPEKSILFHCGFDGYLENRVPNNNNPAPTNECFYDDDGNLVTESHEYGGCRGTPDYYPFFGTGDLTDKERKGPHTDIDSGGQAGPSRTHANIGIEAAVESAKYLKNKGAKSTINTPRKFNFKKK